MAKQKTIVELLKESDERKKNGPWLPACGGSEVPFHTRSGARLLYCYQPSSGKHAYLNCDTDMILTHEEATSLIGIN